MESKYRKYKGMWWKYLVSINDSPVWKISEFEDDSMCYVWLFNATLYSLDEAYNEIKKDNDYNKKL